jgi:hypothetical protein
MERCGRCRIAEIAGLTRGRVAQILRRAPGL